MSSEGSRGLADRLGFPGQRGLVDLDRLRDDQAAVSGKSVTRLEQDDVAGDQPGGVLVANRSTAPDPGGGDEHVAQGFEAAFGPVLLDEADGGVDEEHYADDDGVFELPDHSSERSGAEQDEDEEATELVEEPQRCWPPPPLR